jgi:hypothetical protein
MGAGGKRKYEKVDVKLVVKKSSTQYRDKFADMEWFTLREICEEKLPGEVDENAKIADVRKVVKDSHCIFSSSLSFCMHALCTAIRCWH